VRVYYRAGSVLVTGTTFQVTGRPPRRIAEFNDVYVVNVRGAESPRWTVHRRWPVLVVVAACVAVAVHDVTSGRGTPLLVPAIVLLVCAVTVLVTGRGTDSIDELWAVTGKGHVCLLRSRDKRTFGQIRRALVRAREDGSP
jgi:hypothetical protein